MDVDTASDNTSIDDKIDDFCENPTRDALTEGLMSLLKPTVDQLDERIRATRWTRFFYCDSGSTIAPLGVYDSVFIPYNLLYYYVLTVFVIFVDITSMTNVHV